MSMVASPVILPGGDEQVSVMYYADRICIEAVFVTGERFDSFQFVLRMERKMSLKWCSKRSFSSMVCSLLNVPGLSICVYKA